jgi:hypothetical protein
MLEYGYRGVEGAVLLDAWKCGVWVDTWVVRVRWGHWRRQSAACRPSVPSAKCFAMWKYGIVPRVTFPADSLDMRLHRSSDENLFFVPFDLMWVHIVVICGVCAPRVSRCSLLGSLSFQIDDISAALQPFLVVQCLYFGFRNNLARSWYFQGYGVLLRQ